MTVLVNIPGMQDDVIVAGAPQRVWLDHRRTVLAALLHIVKRDAKPVGGSKPNDLKMRLGEAANGNMKRALANDTLPACEL